jgi:hypothetical protein
MSFDKFFEGEIKTVLRSPIEIERRNRIRLSVAAYAYEFQSDSIMSDGDFDALALSINKDVSTDNEEMDRFFREEFEPDTGQWIHAHPNLQGIERLYIRYFKIRRKRK